MLRKFHLRTSKRSEMIDITRQVREAVREAGKADGLVMVYCPHTTAGITINEGADPDVVQDILMRLDELYPWHHSLYRHGEGNSAAHLKACAVGASQTIPYAEGSLLRAPGRQSIFVNLTGPASRHSWLK